jgi:hypothetical protein
MKIKRKTYLFCQFFWRLFMKEFIISLALFNGVEQVKESLRPQPTPQQIKLVAELGDRQWRVRDAADKELRAMGYDALVALEKKGFLSESQEIQSRSVNIHAFYFRAVASNNEIPLCTGLYKLGEVKLKSGKKIKIAQGTAKEYLLSFIHPDYQYQLYYCYNPDEHKMILQLVTLNYIKDLYKAGYKREEVIEVLNCMEINQKKWTPFDLQYDEDHPYSDR